MKGVQIKDNRERKKVFSFSFFLFRRHSNNITAKKQNITKQNKKQQTNTQTKSLQHLPAPLLCHTVGT